MKGEISCVLSILEKAGCVFFSLQQRSERKKRIVRANSQKAARQDEEYHAGEERGRPERHSRRFVSEAKATTAIADS